MSRYLFQLVFLAEIFAVAFAVLMGILAHSVALFLFLVIALTGGVILAGITVYKRVLLREYKRDE